MKNTSELDYRPHPDERFFDLLAILLLFFAMIAAALRLSATDWTKHLEITQAIAFWGVLLGILVGKSIYSPRAAFLFGLDYGLILIPWHLGTIFFASGVEWQERLLSMAGRLGNILGEISRREQVSDNFLFLLLMAILFWCLSAYAGYILVRRAGMWRAVIPMGITILVIESFDPLLTRRSWFVAIYLFLVLLLVARTQFLLNTKRWREGKTYVPSDAGLDQTRIAIGVVLILVLLAWNMPTLGGDFPIFSTLYRDRIEPLRQEISDRVSFLFSSLRESVGLVYDYYSDQMILGSGSARSDKLELSIEAPGYLYVGQRFYWRARVYDVYEEGGWKTSITGKKVYSANTPLAIPDSPTRTQAIFRFRPAQSMMTLYAAGQALQFSRAGEIQSAANPDGSVDVIGTKAIPFIRAGEYYEVTASLPSFTEKDLRAAGTDYPGWVTARYLQLPEEITPRTIVLAQSIAGNYNNAYDVTAAITDYLRRNIEYVETIEQLPGRQEAVDWFLFDYQKGFCNYYATAQVVLLRAVGIPARLAVGYAQGEGAQVEPMPGESRELRFEEGFQENRIVYTVRQRNAHAWPEVFFPGLGWVEFEPTVSEEPIFRPSGETIPLEPLDDAIPDLERDRPPVRPPEELGQESGLNETDADKPSPLSIGLGIIAFGVVLGLVGLALFAWQRRSPVLTAWLQRVRIFRTPLPVRLERSMRNLGLRPPGFLVRMAYYHQLPELSKAYIEIDRALDRLGRAPHPSQTPSERAVELIQALPFVRTAIDQLVVEYQLGTYSPYPADSTVAQEASALIRRQSKIALLNNRYQQVLRSIKFKLGIRG